MPNCSPKAKGFETTFLGDDLSLLTGLLSNHHKQKPIPAGVGARSERLHAEAAESAGL